MTVLFLTLMVVALVAAQLYLTLKRRRVAERARAAVCYVEAGRASKPARETLFHPGHTWVQFHGDDLASIGASSFATNFIGELESVRTPAQGQRLHQADAACTLVSKRGRRLEMPMPIDGEVLAVNEALLGEPHLLRDRPYDKGWILRVKPRHLAQSVRNLLPAAAAQRWMDSARAEISACTAGMPTAVAFDGGEWAPAFGDRLDDRDWETLRAQLFPDGVREVEEDQLAES